MACFKSTRLPGFYPIGISRGWARTSACPTALLGVSDTHRVGEWVSQIIGQWEPECLPLVTQEEEKIVLYS